MLVHIKVIVQDESHVLGRRESVDGIQKGPSHLLEFDCCVDAWCRIYLLRKHRFVVLNR